MEEKTSENIYVKDAEGNITDVTISYTEGYDEQMLRYSTEYATLPYRN